MERASATLVEFRDAATFVSLDRPERPAGEILAWAGVGATP